MPLVMPQRANRLTLPRVGTPLARGSPLGQGLVAFHAFNTGGGSIVPDGIPGGLPLSVKGSATVVRGGLLCDAAGEGAELTLLPRHQLALPITVACRVMPLGSADNNTGCWGILENNSDAFPYASIHIYVQADGNIWYDANNGGSFISGSSGLAWTSFVGQWLTLVLVFTAARHQMYLNGQSVINDTTTVGLAPNYSGSALLAAGSYTGTSRNLNGLIAWGGVWNRALTQQEAMSLYVAPMQMFASPAWQLWPLHVAAAAAASRPIFQPRWRRQPKTRMI